MSRQLRLSRERDLELQHDRLRASEERFAKVFRRNPDPMVLTSLRSGLILEVNESFEKLFGYGAAEAVGTTPVTLGLWARPEEREELLRSIREGGTVRETEVELRTRSGQRLVCSLSAEVVEFAGEPCALTVGRDVTERHLAQQALHESEEKFSKVFRSSPEAITIATAKGGVFLEVNESFERQYGYSAHEVIGRSAFDIGLWVHPEQRAELAHSIEREGRVRELEVEIRKKTGEVVTSAVSADIMEFAGEACLVTISRDVTARRRAEQALRESEEKFSKVFRSSPDSITVSSLPDARYLVVNDGFERLFGYSREEALGRSVVALDIWVDPEERGRLIALLEAHGRVSDFEASLRTKAGEERLCSLSADVIEVSGRPHLVAVTRDVTERRQAEQRLRDGEERLRLALEAARMGSWEWNLSNGQAQWSEQVGPLFGLPQGFAGTYDAYRDLIHPEDRAAVDRLVTDTLRGNREDFHVEHRIAGPEGTLRWIEARGRVYRDGAGRPILLRGTVADITRTAELKERLRRREKLAAMGSLVAGVAHEVRTPLFSISATLDAYEGHLADTEAQQELMGVLRSQVTRLSNLMSDLLDYARPPSLVLATGSVEDSVRRAVRSCTSLAEQARVQIREDLAGDLPLVNRDSSRLEQVFQNLLANAIQHAPPSSTVHVSARPAQAGARRHGIAVTIEDEGRGLPAGDLGRVFEPWFSRRKGGTGLGLSIVQRIVEEHGGSVSVANRPRGGAVFTVFLPRSPDPSAGGPVPRREKRRPTSRRALRSAASADSAPAASRAAHRARER